MAVVSILSLPIDQGLRQLVAQQVAGYEHDGSWDLISGLFRQGTRWVLMASIFIALIVAPIAAYEARWTAHDRWTVLLLGILVLPFLGLNAVRAGILRGFSYVVAAHLPELLIRPTLHLCVVLTLLFLGVLTPITAIGSQLFGAIMAFIFGAYLLRSRLPPNVGMAEPKHDVRLWLSAWLSFALLMAASLVNNQLAVILLGLLSSNEQVAAFRVAEQGSQLIAMSLGTIGVVIGPYVTQAYRSGNRRRLQNLSRQSARAALAVSAPLGLPLIIFGAPILMFVVGSEYVPLAVTPLAVLVVGQLVNVAFGAVGMLLMMSGFERKIITSHIVALLVNASLAFALIPSYGADGAAFASASALIVLNVMLGIKVANLLRIRVGVF